MNKDLVLIHHGIEGQKWGKRNGPPYPLSRQKKMSKKQSLVYEAKNLPDDELKRRVQRLNYERQYVNLTNDPAFDTRSYALKLLARFGNTYINEVTDSSARKLGKLTVDSFGDFIVKKSSKDSKADNQNEQDNNKK